MCLLMNYVVDVVVDERVVVFVAAAYKCPYNLARHLDSFIRGIWRRAKNETRQDKNECCTGKLSEKQKKKT